MATEHEAQTIILTDDEKESILRGETNTIIRAIKPQPSPGTDMVMLSGNISPSGSRMKWHAMTVGC